MLMIKLMKDFTTIERISGSFVTNNFTNDTRSRILPIEGFQHTYLD